MLPGQTGMGHVEFHLEKFSSLFQSSVFGESTMLAVVKC